MLTRWNHACFLLAAAAVALLISLPAQADADVSIVKTITTPGPYSAGQSITYTLSVHNAGPSPATGVTVNDTPTNMTITFVNGPTNNFFACLGFPCSLTPPLAVGETRSFTVTATINSAGAFSNTATANGSDLDPDPSNNTDTEGGVATAADVSIVKTITTPGPYSAGQSITYTLSIHNAGPSAATGVTVNDTPTNMTITFVNGPTNNFFACLGFPCSLTPPLGVGETRSFTVTATINSVGVFSNTATANGSDVDPDPSNNTDTEGGVATAADVSIVKTITTPGPYSAGQSINYTLSVHNAGPSPATGVTVNDTPANMTITFVNGPTNNFFACLGFPCSLTPPLAVGETRSFTVTATINSVGAFSNTATANGSDLDPDPSNNTDTEGGVATAADVSIVKTITTPGPYSAGQSITYTLSIHNAGPSPATGVTVNDTPENMTITFVNGPTNNFFACLGFPCPLSPPLAAGETRSFTVTATINSDGAFSNTATANGSDLDPDPSNNASTAGGATLASADVSMTKTLVSAGPFTIDQSIQYTLVVANDGPSPATNIQVTDAPANLTLTSVGGGCSALPCTIASLGNGAAITIHVTARIDASPFDNSATATASEFDPDPTNNIDNSSNGGTAVASADVSVVKTLITAGPFVAGQSISYTILVSNAGPSPAANIQVTDTPANLALTTVSGAGCATLPCTIASLAAGANTTIHVSATITAAGPFDNGASAIAAESDPTTANNVDGSGNGANATIAAGIPTLGEWTLALLALLLGALGFVIVRR